MKAISTIFILLVFLFFNLYYSHAANITGRITGKVPKEVYCSVPINGVAYDGFREAVRTDSLGNFQIKINSKETAFVILMVPGINPRKIIIEPGEDFHISIDTEKDSANFIISGPNESGQNLYNTLPNPVLVQFEARKFLKESSIDSIKKKISALKSKDILMFRELLMKKEISQSFFNFISSDRDCYYATLSASIPLISYFKTNPNQLEKFPLELKKLWKDIYADYPLDRTDLLHSPWWYEYAKTYLNFKEYFSDSFKIQNLNDFNKQGLIHTHNIGESKKYLTGGGLEYYNAAYIFIETYQRKYEKEFIKIFDQYKTDFPESKYIKFLEPMMTPIIEFHKNVNENKNIKFINGSEKLGSLKEISEFFKGKKIYIDVWATWCGPCKDEFRNKENLLKLLKTKGIDLVYISLDKDENDKQWKNMIRYYNLEGYHIRANKKLEMNLRKIFNENGSISIPWYILINEKGMIIKDHAKRPSQIEELKKEIYEI